MIDDALNSVNETVSAMQGAKVYLEVDQYVLNDVLTDAAKALEEARGLIEDKDSKIEDLNTEIQSLRVVIEDLEADVQELRN